MSVSFVPPVKSHTPEPRVNRETSKLVRPPEMDFSVIDTAQKADLLPAMNVDIQDTTMLYIDAARRYNLNFACDLEQYMGKIDNPTPARLHYTLPARTGTAQAEGTIGDTPIKETWTQAKDGTVTLSGFVGSTPENLVWSYDRKTLTWHLDGNIGTIEVHKSRHGKEPWRGTVGDSTITEEEKMDVDHDHVITGLHLSGGLQPPSGKSLATQVDSTLVTTPAGNCLAARGTIVNVRVEYTHLTQQVASIAPRVLNQV